MVKEIRFSEIAHKVNLEALNMPTNCSVCTAILKFEDAYLVCPNPACQAKVKGNIHKFVETIDVKNVGTETISALVDMGFVKCPADLYEVTQEQFCRIDRKGPAHYVKMKAGLAARKKISVEKFFGALNVQGAGEGTFVNLAQAGYNTFEKIMSLTTVQAMSAMRVGEQAAASIVAFLGSNKQNIERLKGYLEIQSREGKPLEGRSFIITGSLSRPKNEIYADIEAAGGMVAKGITRSLSYLIAADPNSTSTKAQKARSLGVQMITEKQVMDMLAKN